MSGVAVETMLELWVSELRGAKARIRPLFSRERVGLWCTDRACGRIDPNPARGQAMRT